MKKIATPHFDFESKKAYEKPSMRVVELQHRTCLLQASGTPPNEIPDYDDWME